MGERQRGMVSPLNINPAYGALPTTHTRRHQTGSETARIRNNLRRNCTCFRMWRHVYCLSVSECVVS